MIQPQKVVLIIEDDPDLVDLLGYNLEKEGYKVIRAHSGIQAIWKVVEQNRPHCILLDLMIPSPDGYEICDYLKGSEDLRDIPLIIISARGERESIEKVMNLGADAFLPKPFSIESLLNLVNHYSSPGPMIKARYQVRQVDKFNH
jgi:DNA-binding response OmpR family regulator